MVLAYDQKGLALFLVRGKLAEFCPAWVAIRTEDEVIVCHDDATRCQRIAHADWNKGVRPKRKRWWLPWQAATAPEVKRRALVL